MNTDKIRAFLAATDAMECHALAVAAKLGITIHRFADCVFDVGGVAILHEETWAFQGHEDHRDYIEAHWLLATNEELATEKARREQVVKDEAEAKRLKAIADRQAHLEYEKMRLMLGC